MPEKCSFCREQAVTYAAVCSGHAKLLNTLIKPKPVRKPKGGSTNA